MLLMENLVCMCIRKLRKTLPICIEKKNSLLSKDYKLSFVAKKTLIYLHVNNNDTDQPVNNKGTDQPVHLHSLISIFVIFCLDIIIATLTTCKISGF